MSSKIEDTTKRTYELSDRACCMSRPLQCQSKNENELTSKVKEASRTLTWLSDLSRGLLEGGSAVK